MRVHELAQELDLPSGVVTQLGQSADTNIRSAASNLTNRQMYAICDLARDPDAVARARADVARQRAVLDERENRQHADDTSPTHRVYDAHGAAELAGVKVGTVYQWVRRGHLHPSGEYDGMLFVGGDVITCMTSRRDAVASTADCLADAIETHGRAHVVTNKEAAELAGVSPATVSNWVRRGHLEPFDHTDAGRPLFMLGAVEACKSKRA